MKKNFRLNISLLILLIFMFALYNLNEIEKRATEAQYGILISDLSEITSDFSVWIGTKQNILDTAKDIVNNFSYEEITKASTLNELLNINNDDPFVSQVYIGLSNGEFITGGEWVPPSNYDPRTRVWYQDAIEANDTVVSRVYYDRETGDQTITISSPLYLENELIGVMSIDVFLDDIQSYLTNQIGNESTFAYLLDSDGIFIAHTKNTALIGKNLFDVVENEVLLNYFNEGLKTPDESLELEYKLFEQEYRGITQKIDGTNWFLVVTAEVEPVSFSFNELRNETFGVNFILMVVMLIIIYIIVGSKRELDRMNRSLKIESERDYLTGVHNRRYLNVYMEDLWDKIKEETPLSLLMIDIDYFKQYNDHYGHLHGDIILKDIVKVISESLRKEDFIARFGGEEFLVILENVDTNNANLVAEKIKKQVYDMNILHEKSDYHRLTISIGVLTFNKKSGIDMAEGIELADQALYIAKDSGRNAIYAIEKGEN